jgi:hypothetical protein
MILQQLAANLRARDWGAVLIEILILVVGVFLGLQVDNWNDARKTAADERYYIQRLQDELAESITRLDNSIAVGYSVIDAVRRAQQAIRDGTIEVHHPEAFIADFASVNWMAEADVVDGAIEELRSTGRMEIIGDRRIREALSRYYRTLQSARSQEEISNRGWTLALADIYRQVDATLNPDRDDWLSVDVSSMNGNDRVARALFLASLYQLSQVNALEHLRAETQALITLVTRALGQ